MLRCQKFDVVIVWRGTQRKLAKVMFGKDGSFYVMFPGFRNYPGIASHIVLPASPGGHIPSNHNLADGGKVTSHMVKYSHHPDGRAHFSQDGKVVTTIRRNAAPLEAQTGHLFTVHVQNLDALSVATASRPEMVRFEVPDDTQVVKVIGWRFSTNAFRVSPPPGREWSEGTDVPLMTDFDGIQRPALARGPLLGTPMDDRVIVLTAELLPTFATDREDSLTFIGGFDVNEIALNHAHETGFLGMAYPCSDFDELQRAIGDMDYRPRSEPSEHQDA